MAFPKGWPPSPASGLRSIRFYISGTTTGDFADNAFLFSQGTAANTFKPTPFVPPGGEKVLAKVGTLTDGGGSPMGGGMDAHDANIAAVPSEQAVPETMIWAHTLRISNDGAADIQFSFDGTTVHGVVKADEKIIYPHRYEAGVAVRNQAAGAIAFRIEAW
jgi:hypothetical protein